MGRKRIRKKRSPEESEQTDGNWKSEESPVTWTDDSIPDELRKYWRHRHSLFVRFDEGIRIDYEGWYSVTPEEIARHIAVRCNNNTRKKVVIDAFCGVGGNAIQFALAGFEVVAIDIDPSKVECTRHNASIYGVGDRITYRVGDFFRLAHELQGDVVFLSPPWGGPEYLNAEVFDIETMMPVNGTELFKVASKITRNIVYYVPRNVDSDQMINLAGSGCVCELEEVYLNDRAKVLCVYYGDLVAAV